MTSKILQCLLFIVADGNVPITKSQATELTRTPSMPFRPAITADSMSFQEYAKLSFDRLFSWVFSGTIAASPKQKTDINQF